MSPTAVDSCVHDAKNGKTIVQKTTVEKRETSSLDVGYRYEGATESMKFECQFPGTTRNVKRVVKAIPFPDTLEETIEWTDAYVDRIAAMTKASHQKFIYQLGLQTAEITRHKETITTKETTIREHVTTIRELNCTIDRLRGDISARDAGICKRDDRIKQLEKEKRDLDAWFREEIKKWKAEDRKDNAMIEDLTRQLCELRNAKAGVESRLADANATVAARDEVIKALRAELDRLRKDISVLNGKIDALNITIRITKEQVAAANRKIQEAEATIEKLRQELAGALKKYADRDDEFQKHVTVCTATILRLQTEITQLTSERDQHKGKADGYKTETERLTQTVSEFKTTIETLERELKKEQGVSLDWKTRYNRETSHWSMKEADIQEREENLESTISDMEAKWKDQQAVVVNDLTRTKDDLVKKQAQSTKKIADLRTMNNEDEAFIDMLIKGGQEAAKAAEEWEIVKRTRQTTEETRRTTELTKSKSSSGN